MSVGSEEKQRSEHRYLILIVVKVKQHSERSQRFHFRINEKKPP